MNRASKLLLAIGGGIAVGVLAGVLFAPEGGSETRKKILKRGKKLAGTVSDGVADSRESLEEIKDVLQKQLHKVTRKIEEIRS